MRTPLPWLSLLLLGCPAGPETRPLVLHTGDTSDTSDTGEPPAYYGPVLYPADTLHGPITPYVADRMRAIADVGSTLQDDVFMKVGASSTKSTHSYDCFAGDDVDLGVHTDLQPTMEYFLGGDAGGTDPFSRDTAAARVGVSAVWAISGDPSPLETEIDAIAPRFAFIHYGTNDMQLGTTYASAIPGFYDSYSALLDQLIGQGIVPIVVGITPREDSTAADRWVETYNAVIRGMAQMRQVPYANLHLAFEALPGQGLAGDGLHPNVFPGGACVLTEEGLEYGYNTRNLAALESLQRVAAVVVDGAESLDPPGEPIEGQGSPEDPWRIPELPFAHHADTSTSPHELIDSYPACGSSADEAGPELYYTVEVSEATPIRALVLDHGEVDIDVHLLAGGPDPNGCVERAHRLIETTLTPGTWTFVLDSWVDGDGDVREGEYLFAVVRCEPGDGDCPG
jgi:hypothetical protein